MSTTAAFVLGLLIGWVVEWIIDWIYWRRKTSALQEEVAQLRESLSRSESHNADLERQLTLPQATLISLQEKLERTEAELAQARSQLEAQKQADLTPKTQDEALSEPAPELLKESPPDQAVSFAVGEAAPETAPETEVTETAAMGVVSQTRAAPIERDDLEVIKGIGPVIARKLNNEGIYCFADLAAMTPDQLRAMVGDIISRLADEDSIIEQAKHLAEQKRSGG